MRKNMERAMKNPYIAPGIMTPTAQIIHEVRLYFNTDLASLALEGRQKHNIIIRKIFTFLLAYQNYLDTGNYNPTKIAFLLHLDHSSIVYYIKNIHHITLNKDIERHLMILCNYLDIPFDHLKQTLYEIELRTRRNN